MPLYEYACAACRARFEVLQRMGEGSDAIRCPDCGGSEVERRLSTFAAATGGRSGSFDTGGFDSGGCGRPQCGAGSGFT
jgi:putative FmdB family regulatory protein